MATFNGSEVAAGNDEQLYLASQVGDHDSIYIFMQQNMSTFEYSSAGWHDIEAGVPEKNYAWLIIKGFGGRQYQKTTLASNPKRD